MKVSGPFSKRMGRYGACVVFFAVVGVVFCVGALKHIPLQQLWSPLIWGGAAGLLLGWAVGHAAGRLFYEVNPKAKTPEGRTGPKGETASKEETRTGGDAGEPVDTEAEKRSSAVFCTRRTPLVAASQHIIRRVSYSFTTDVLMGYGVAGADLTGFRADDRRVYRPRRCSFVASFFRPCVPRPAALVDLAPRRG